MTQISYDLANIGDEYYESGIDKNEFYGRLMDQKMHSVWVPGVLFNQIKMNTLIGLEAETFHSNVDQEIVRDTAGTDGSHLTCRYINEKWLIRKSALQDLETLAGISGPVMAKMTRYYTEKYADTINNCFEVAPESKTAQLLIREGKLTSAHGEDYVIIDADELYSETVSSLTKRFGEPELLSWYLSHTEVNCKWALPKAQNQMLSKYMEVLQELNTNSVYAINFMPGVEFWTSDAGKRCATLRPVFYINNDRTRPVYFGTGIAVRHDKGNREVYGIDEYRNAIEDIYAMFEDAMENIRRLSEITIYNPMNCIVKLCNRYHIAPLYGESARTEIEHYTEGAVCTAHDCYICLSECLSAAENKGASRSVMVKLKEAMALISKISDWSEYDIGGIVAWRS